MAKFTVQKLLHDNLAAILAQRNFPLNQHKALQSLCACRTAALGGHTQVCPNGHVNGIWYNSCKHRACPQCQCMASEQWLQNTQALLLDCPHHHVIFTLPEELHNLWRFNRSLMMSILFEAAQATLKTFYQNPKYLGAIPGILLALHTWGRSMNLHPHLHVLISHGGLNSNGEWIKPKKKHIFPQEPVMRMFRGKLLSLLRRASLRNELVLGAENVDQYLQQILPVMRKKDWVVHFCDRYNHPRGVATYLSRYIKRSPFKNSQIRAVTATHVRFIYQSHQSHKRESMTFSIADFISRIMEHVPLARKPSVHYCGLYTSALRKKLNVAKQALGQSVTHKPDPLKWEGFMERFANRPVCKICGLTVSHQDVVARIKLVA